MVDKIANPSLVANLYANTSKVADGGGMDDAGGLNFGQILRAGIQSSVNTMKAAESASAAAVAGKADLNDVVQAITKAEMTLQTVVAIRDRMLNAYQEILRMPI